MAIAWLGLATYALPTCARTAGRQWPPHLRAAADSRPSDRLWSSRLRGRHRHRVPRPAEDGLEDVLRLLDGLTRRPAEQPHVSGLPGLPGALPVINRRAVEHVLATGVAIGAPPRGDALGSQDYFYPDLPKGYQISQYDLPLAAARPLPRDRGRAVHGRHHPGPSRGGHRQAHPCHGRRGRAVSLVDFNRSGTPLMEIVTEPVSGRPSRRAATPRSCSSCSGHRRVRCRHGEGPDARRGQRLAPARGTEAFGTRVEVKNMNSFRSVERAIAFEIERQAAALDAGETARPGDRGWDDERGETYRDAVQGGRRDDYRYFPEPDLPPLRVDPAWLASIRAALPELPAARRARFRTTLACPNTTRRSGRRSCDARRVRGDPARGRPPAQGGRELRHRRVRAGRGGRPQPITSTRVVELHGRRAAISCAWTEPARSLEPMPSRSSRTTCAPAVP